MITMSLVEWRRSVEKIAFWHKSAAIEFLGVYIYIYSTANGPSETVAGEAQRFSGIWLAAIQTDTAQQYLAQLTAHFPWTRTTTMETGSAFMSTSGFTCIPWSPSWFLFHKKKNKQQNQHTPTAHSTELFLVSLLVCCGCCSSASSPGCFLFREDVIHSYI